MNDQELDFDFEEPTIVTDLSALTAKPTARTSPVTRPGYVAPSEATLALWAANNVE